MPLGSEKATLLGAAGGSSTIKMYGFGGNNSGPDPVYNNTEVKIYEESTDSWALGAVLAIGRGGNNNNLGAAWLSDAAYRNGKFWAAYGFAGSTPSAEPSNQYYNSVTNTSAAIGAAPGPSRSIVGYWSMHDKFFCGSGMKYTPNYWSTYNVVQSQAYSNDAWTTHGTGPQNSYTSFASASFSSNTNLAYMFMGRNIPVSGNMPNWGTDIYNVYSYSQSADSWTGLTNSPNNWKPQGNHWIDNINEKCYVWKAGGGPDFMVWTKSSDSWTNLTSSAPVCRSNPSMAANDVVGIGYYGGGEAQAPESPTGNTFASGKYTFATDAWSTITSETVGRIRSLGNFGGITQ